jgi:hypothetical protein
LDSSEQAGVSDDAADAETRSAVLAGGAGLSLAWSLLACLLIVADVQLLRAWRAASEPGLAFSIVAVSATTVAVLIAVPSWVVSTAFALGSLVTVQRRWYLAVLALLLNIASAAVFLLFL